MPDIATRFPQNPILLPADIRPSIPGMTIECLLNPGVFRFEGKTWLLLRVAERPAQKPGKTSFPVLDQRGEARDPGVRQCRSAIGSLRSAGDFLRGPGLPDHDVASAAGGERRRGPFPRAVAQSAHFRPRRTGILWHRRLPGGPDRRRLITSPSPQVSPHGVGVGLAEHDRLARIPLARHDLPAAQQGLRDLRRADRRHVTMPCTGPAAPSWAAITSGSPSRPTWCTGATIAALPTAARACGTAPGSAPGRPRSARREGWLEIYHGATAQHPLLPGGAAAGPCTNRGRCWPARKSRSWSRLPLTSRRASSATWCSPMGTSWTATSVTIYYGASDSVICGARFSIAEILKTLG